MVDPSQSQELRSSFGGAWLNVDTTNVRPDKGLRSQNVQFGPGQTGTRLGFGLAFSTLDSISAMFNWISSLGNLLLWYRTSDRSVRLLNVDVAATASTVIAGDLIGYACKFAEAGARLFLSFFTAAGTGASGARVLSYQGAAFVSDLAFQPPITYVPPSPTEPGTGDVTAGLHLLGYLIEYRSGYITRPSPDSGVGNTPSSNTFTPVQVTAAGNKYFSWTLNTTWPVGAVRVHAIMTPVADQASWFFMPNPQAVTGGVASSITFTMNVSDDTVFTLQNANPALLLLSNSVANVPQFYPSVVLTHGNRMVYVATTPDNVGNVSGALFISAIGRYQDIAPDLSMIQLPGLKDIVTAISLDGTLFIFGPQWTYRTIDNNADPNTWATPILVDGRRGTLAIRGAEVAPSGAYGWVASQDGLYFFQGVFPALPISYYQQPDWDRINWTAKNAVQVKDDPGIKKVYVMAALDSATTPSHLLTWDYTNGFTPDRVQYSIDSLQSYELGSMEVVKNGLPGSVTAAAQKKELWLGSSGDDGIFRRKSVDDANPYLDGVYPVFDAYETSLFPKEGTRGEVYQHHGAEYRLTGDGTVQITAYEVDHARSKDLAIVDLSTGPGKALHRSFDLISEGCSHLISSGRNEVLDPEFEGA
jgi:hypothetical protein